VQGVQIVGEHVINNMSSLIGKSDANSSIKNGVWSLSGRGQIHQGQAASITVKVGSNGIKATHSAMI
jgi:hypothetical protein